MNIGRHQLQGDYLAPQGLTPHSHGTVRMQSSSSQVAHASRLSSVALHATWMT